MKKQPCIRLLALLLTVIFLLSAVDSYAATAPLDLSLLTEFNPYPTKEVVPEHIPVSAVLAAKKAKQTLKIDNNTNGMTYKEKTVYKKIKAQMKKLPEGMEWTNDTCYAFKGGFFSLGFGCSAFVFKMSDIAFGKKKGRMHTKFTSVKVGDIVRMDHNTHSVIVMKKVGSNLVVAEGNYGYSIHWGRVIPLKEVKQTGTYIMTRY